MPALSPFESFQNPLLKFPSLSSNDIKKKISFCFSTGLVTGTANVKMGQAIVCTHAELLFHLAESKHDTYDIAVCMSFPIPTTFCTFIIIIIIIF